MYHFYATSALKVFSIFFAPYLLLMYRYQLAVVCWYAPAGPEVFSYTFGPATLVMPLVLGLTLLCVPYLPWAGDSVFLDKCCISQTDPELKRASIAQLGSYIANSKRMLIVLDGNYCNRLWTTFELAAFCSSHPLDELDVLPAHRPSAIGALLLFHTVASVLLCFGWALTGGNPHVAAYLATHASPEEQVAANCLAIAVVLGVVYLVPADVLYGMVEQNHKVLGTLHEQLAAFRCDKLQCAVEADRPYVEAAITSWFGSLEAFETFVQTTVREALLPMQQRRAVISYGQNLIGCLAHVWLLADTLVLHAPLGARGGDADLLHRCMGFLVTVFCTDYFGVLLVSFVARRLHASDGGTSPSNVTAARAVRRRYIVGLSFGFALLHGINIAVFWNPTVSAAVKWPVALAQVVFVAGMQMGVSTSL